ncbi:MAG: TIGR00366 family protein [Proteobacteria bacterium]|nr:TIGR00366 family protein [Pseudomonadota bacterium]
MPLGDNLLTNVDAFYRGLWMLLPFSMQMTLILVLSTVLSLTAAFRRAIRRIADLPQTVTQVIALAVCVNSILSYLYWGLGLAMGPLIAVYFAEAAERKGLRIDFPFFLATVFAAGSVWQFGLSSTAALLAATPGNFLEQEAGVMALGTTIGSLPALMVTLVFPLSLVLLARYLMPQQVQPISAFPAAAGVGAACCRSRVRQPGTARPAFPAGPSGPSCFPSCSASRSWPDCTTISSTRVSASNSIRWSPCCCCSRC